MTDPLVLVLLSDPAAGPGLAAGFEEEGVPVTVLECRGSPQALAREAASRAVLGIGIGGDGDRLALVLTGGPPRPYLEGAVGDARAFGRNAARLAARRPLRSVPLG